LVITPSIPYPGFFTSQAASSSDMPIVHRAGAAAMVDGPLGFPFPFEVAIER
jgi:hypothetical protein